MHALVARSGFDSSGCARRRGVCLDGQPKSPKMKVAYSPETHDQYPRTKASENMKVDMLLRRRPLCAAPQPYPTKQTLD